MSLLPLLVNLAEGLDNDPYTYDRNAFMDDDFGFGIYPREILAPRAMMRMLPNRRFNPYHKLHSVRKSKDKTDDLKVGKDGFQVCMDVQQFKPNELTVKTVDNYVVVEGRHEEREDEHGLITRHFVRKYQLPKDYDPKEVVTTLSSDGVLTVKAPPPANAQNGNERVIQIQQTGPAHLSVKDTAEKSTEMNGNGHPNENGHSHSVTKNDKKK